MKISNFILVLLLPALTSCSFAFADRNTVPERVVQSSNTAEAFVMIHVSIKDKKKFDEYLSKVSKTIKAYGGKSVVRGNFSGVVSGARDLHQLGAVATFPSLKSIDDWYNSSEYQELIPIRNQGADITIVKYSVPKKQAQ